MSAASKNQIAIPRDVREALGVKAGDQLLAPPLPTTL
jgi:bifunctional DNA-binding transcriptional regulator/antitoxin component of YhaV-PrlF toxin-antitoxin module